VPPYGPLKRALLTAPSGSDCGRDFESPTLSDPWAPPQSGRRARTGADTTSFPRSRKPQVVEFGPAGDDEMAYLTLSHTSLVMLTLPSRENGAGLVVYINRSPSFLTSRTTVVPVHSSFEDMSMWCSIWLP
jgi:hypothetical protein